MLKHHEYTAWISVDGQPLETYAVETSLATNEVACWVVSEAGKEFSVHCQDTSDTVADNIGAIVYIDGQGCRGGMFGHSEGWGTDHTVEISNVFVSDRISRPFVFSKVQLTDGDESTDTSSADLGQIQLRVCKVALGDFVDTSLPCLQTEHSNKAVAHCVGLGEEIMTPQTMMRKTQYIGQPLAIFTFKYRDRNLLEANGIIPLSAPSERWNRALRKIEEKLLRVFNMLYELTGELNELCRDRSLLKANANAPVPAPSKRRDQVLLKLEEMLLRVSNLAYEIMDELRELRRAISLRSEPS
ncbi:hypothetical protein DFH29DRAFT_996564 [Suillus ampliporus]|nr:hypothetical protein DFH29DRAFT_996564 [Suillus ampliporus]